MLFLGLAEISFNTQPPEGGWDTKIEHIDQTNVSTHSRLKAAGILMIIFV